MLLSQVLPKASLVYLRLDAILMAKAFAVESAAIQSELFGESSLELATATLELGEIREIQGQFNKAKVCFKPPEYKSILCLKYFICRHFLNPRR